jgi:hypothetical protein
LAALLLLTVAAGEASLGLPKEEEEEEEERGRKDLRVARLRLLLLLLLLREEAASELPARGEAAAEERAAAEEGPEPGLTEVRQMEPRPGLSAQSSAEEECTPMPERALRREPLWLLSMEASMSCSWARSSLCLCSKCSGGTDWLLTISAGPACSSWASLGAWGGRLLAEERGGKESCCCCCPPSLKECRGFLYCREESQDGELDAGKWKEEGRPERRGLENCREGSAEGKPSKWLGG